jgi:hypothetical protein
MTEPINDLSRPELCEECKGVAEGKRHRAHCKTFPITCEDQRELWDSGYAAGKAAAGEECTLLAASLKQAAAISHARYELYDAATKRAEAAESKLAELVRRVRAWASNEGDMRDVDAILDEYAKPEGS